MHKAENPKRLPWISKLSRENTALPVRRFCSFVFVFSYAACLDKHQMQHSTQSCGMQTSNLCTTAPTGVCSVSVTCTSFRLSSASTSCFLGWVEFFSRQSVLILLNNFLFYFHFKCVISYYLESNFCENEATHSSLRHMSSPAWNVVQSLLNKPENCRLSQECDYLLFSLRYAICLVNVVLVEKRSAVDDYINVII